MLLSGSEEGNTTTTLVKIMVQDVNDMAPEFTSVPTGKYCCRKAALQLMMSFFCQIHYSTNIIMNDDKAQGRLDR